MNEGQAVAWAGPALEGHTMGDSGTLLAFAGRDSAHVMWSTGARCGETDLVEVEDLAPVTASRGLVEDSLSVGISTVGVREIYDAQGEVGVLNAMASMGHTLGFSGIAEEAMASVRAAVRRDPSIRAVTAQLDDEEAESVVRLAALCLIRDAFDVEEG